MGGKGGTLSIWARDSQAGKWADGKREEEASSRDPLTGFVVLPSSRDVPDDACIRVAGTLKALISTSYLPFSSDTLQRRHQTALHDEAKKAGRQGRNKRNVLFPSASFLPQVRR
ncbi:hypothetical protein CPAR01_10756 [Colletotrichum paranaense]|uniref:Uncharacterized protein n=1 Tax=Colletotrichum paranaense TaxID=1914294 RepID=A0ABQ9S9P3_9PEZI|nr:uncharacterized protein CPAR01_10756 [Colletotrichum paranaense]KAK1531107.1 hypothetical protein CPAR01_10756 [Colletotrichum paranaense]